MEHPTEDMEGSNKQPKLDLESSEEPQDNSVSDKLDAINKVNELEVAKETLQILDEISDTELIDDDEHSHITSNMADKDQIKEPSIEIIYPETVAKKKEKKSNLKKEQKQALKNEKEQIKDFNSKSKQARELNRHAKKYAKSGIFRKKDPTKASKLFYRAAHLFSQTNNLDSALECYILALENYRKVENYKQAGKSAKHTSSIFVRKGDGSKAIPYYNESYQLFMKANEKLMAADLCLEAFLSLPTKYNIDRVRLILQAIAIYIDPEVQATSSQLDKTMSKKEEISSKKGEIVEKKSEDHVEEENVKDAKSNAEKAFHCFLLLISLYVKYKKFQDALIQFIPILKLSKELTLLGQSEYGWDWSKAVYKVVLFNVVVFLFNDDVLEAAKVVKEFPDYTEIEELNFAAKLIVPFKGKAQNKWDSLLTDNKELFITSEAFNLISSFSLSDFN